MFDEERKALHRRLGRERGDRVFALVIAMDAVERSESSGRPRWAKPPPGNPADIKAELERVLEFSDEDLIRLAGVAEDAIRRTTQAYPPPARN